ncbi:MAG: hypothetical protein Q9214_001719 [Letrouitia sp. 1 TL-2023]
MSQYIPSFLIEPVVRHARRFSGRSANNDHQPAPSETQNNVVHDHRVGAVDSHALGLQEGDHAIGINVSRSNYTTSADNEVTFPAPENESGEDSHIWATLRRISNVVTRQSEYPEEEAIADSRGSVSSAEGALNTFLQSTPISSDLSPQSMTENAENSMNEPTETRDQGMDWDLENYHSLGDSLPADDGMSLLRKRILAIQRTSSSSAEKALRVHQLMTERSFSSKAMREEPHSAHSSFQDSLANYSRSPTKSPASSLENKVLSTLPPASRSVTPQGVKSFNLSSSDLQPTYYHEASHCVDSESMETMSSSGQSLKEYEGRPRPLGCPHYRRNIKLKCSICGRWYTCRFCHDNAEDHSLKRRETKYMLCMLCGSAQAASGNCLNCGEPSARYYCDVCKLWDDDPAKSIYHCYDCGICRVGQGLGKDFYHCKVSRCLLMVLVFASLKNQFTNGD